MANSKIILSKVADPERLKPFRTNAALILTTLMLMVAAATTVATAQTYTDLYNFDGTDGAEPQYSLLAQGRDGNWYGTASFGGANGYGVVFRITPGGKLKVLYNFEGVHGAYPIWRIDARDGRELLRHDLHRRQRIRNDLQGYEERKPDHTPRLHGICRRALRASHPGCRRKFLRHDGRCGCVYKITSSGTFTLLGYTSRRLFGPTVPGNKWELLWHDLRWR